MTSYNIRRKCEKIRIVLYIAILNILFPQIVKSQKSDGITFENNINWEELKAKAKQEKKYIFIDCFATWCGPCRLMDKEVYSSTEVGQFINKYFISLKLQMDTTSRDGINIRKQYKDASFFKEEYLINSFPTYLFFSPEGELVHRYTGGIVSKSFIEVAHNAITPSKQYYKIKGLYRAGIKDYSNMRYFAYIAQLIDTKYFIDTIVRDYITNYLNLDNEAWKDKKNLDFVQNFKQLLKSNDNVLSSLFHNDISIDSIMGKAKFSQSILDYIITKEEITPFLSKENKATQDIPLHPNWPLLKNKIKMKYNSDYAERNVLNAQLKWYIERKNWPEITKYFIQQKEREGIDTLGLAKVVLNNQIWEIIFEHSNDSSALKKGIEWTTLLMKSDPQNVAIIDTHANLLYKLGLINPALGYESRALCIAEEKRDTPNIEIFKRTIEKMKLGLPTWTTKTSSLN